MLILLPPSERKRSAARGRPVDVAALSHPELTDARVAVLDALATASGGPDACARLGAPATAAAEVAGNARWRSAPAQRVDRLYTGVLFEALDVGTLPPPARRRAREWTRVVSAAHGLLALDDAVPAYRLAMGVTLPGIGPLAAYWRAHLAPVLDGLVRTGGGVVLDGRSSAYAAVWSPPRELADRVVALRVLSVHGDTSRVVSHAAKHTRGLVARHLLLRGGRAPQTADALVAAIADRFEVDDQGHRAGRVRRVDVLLRA